MSEPVFTNLQVTPLNRQNSTKASGIVTIGNLINVRFTVADGRNGLWVKLPQHTYMHKAEDGKEERRWVKDVKFVDDELYKSLTDTVLTEYQKKVNGSQNGESQPANDGKNW